MKNIYIHIGNFKTGTTAIQLYCRHHRAELAENDIYIPNKIHHEDISLGLCKRHNIAIPPWYKNKSSLHKTIKTLNQEVNKSKCQNILVSSEEFARIDSAAAISELTSFLNNYNIKIIYYVRESVEFLSSFYREVIKTAKYPPGRFIDFCDKLENTFLDQSLVYSSWKNEIGSENIILRKYPHTEDHVSSFLKIINSNYQIKHTENKKHISENVNLSLATQQSETKRRIDISNISHKIDADFLLRSNTGGNPYQMSKFISKIEHHSNNQRISLLNRIKVNHYHSHELVEKEIEINGPPKLHSGELEFFIDLYNENKESDTFSELFFQQLSILKGDANKPM
tara:strand:- start:9540 stop:10559 length:1020 start_codon:yes stop_codon:yes gene_type:complete